MDAEINDLVRQIAAEPAEERHLCRAILRLEAALRRGGLLGRPDRLPELGALMRAAGLTAEGETKWDSKRNWQGCPTDEEFRALQAKEDLKGDLARAREKYPPIYPDPDREYLNPLDEPLHYHCWQAPPVGLVAKRRMEKHEEGVRVVVGAVCDRLVDRDVHRQPPNGFCRTCSCFSLRWGLGFWRVVNVYRWRDDGKWRRTPVLSDNDETYETPHWLRPAPELDVPAKLVSEIVATEGQRGVISVMESY